MKDDNWGGLAILSIALFLFALVYAVVFGIQRDDARAEVEELKKRVVVCPMCSGRGVVDLPKVEVEHGK